MKKLTQRNTSKAAFIPLLFFFAVLGQALLLLIISIAAPVTPVGSLIPTPVALAAIEVPTSQQNSLPKASDKPTIQTWVQAIPAKAPAKIIIKKITAEARLVISKIKVNAVIQDMGRTSKGAMAVPGNNRDVGWYSLGTIPGNIGSAVIGGHNVWGGAPGVFVRLDELQIGDIVSVVDAKGVVTSFVVVNLHTFDAKDADSGIFGSESGTHLNLITCSGAWDASAQSYTTRLVVYTDAVTTAE